MIEIQRRGHQKIGREGDPCINFCLAILKEAKRADMKMWRDFIKEFDIKKRSQDPFTVAVFVGDWMERDFVKSKVEGIWGDPYICPECIIVTHTEGECDICGTELIQDIPDHRPKGLVWSAPAPN